MLPAPIGQLPFATEPSDVADHWAGALADAFNDRRQLSGFLPQAEQAVRACPGDAHILCLAATAALFDGHTERALVFLKRYTKRYVATGTAHLLHALALAHQNKLGPARVLLQSHGLTDFYDAARAFPGGPNRRAWLSERLGTILGRPAAVGLRLTAARGKSATNKPATKPASKPRAAKPARQSPAPAAAVARQASEQPVALPALPLLDVDIPLTVEFDLAPLAAATGAQPEVEGSWYRLQERLAHLSLAQGFDELLCLPHLRGIETPWHQVEAVRKVLKQFRARVLLADEVGLGKTVEAGMVPKEYLLRGMVERVLILVPASLVGQWREEIESKFGIDCATTHDPLLRDDPERFWNQPRLIASLALARRREHAAHLSSRPFDLVIVDEAHHLRDRASQGYKLVDGLNKRFLLLLSATRQMVPTEPPPPPDPERLIATSIELPNAIWRLQRMTPTWTRCLILTFRYTALSDEKREGLVRLAFNLGTGATLDDEWLRRHADLSEASRWQAPDPAVRDAAGPGWEAPGIEARARPLLDHRVKQELQPFLRSMRRRLDRDRTRVHAYHSDLRSVAQKRLAGLAGAAGEKPEADRRRETLRLAAIEREYRAKLDDLRHNYALRVAVEWVQALELYLPVQRLDVLIRRRKGERVIKFDWDQSTRMAEFIPCDWGLGLDRVRLVCDERLHLTEPAGQAACHSCGKAWCRACHPVSCPRCAAPVEAQASEAPGCA